MEQTNRIRGVIGAGFAVLLGVGIAAVFQTFVWENSVTLVAGTYETLGRLDGIAYSSKAAEAAALRFASSSDPRAAIECRSDLAQVRNLLTALNNSAFEGPAYQSLKGHLTELVDEEYVAVRGVLETPVPARMAQVMATRDASGARTEMQTAIESLRVEVRQMLDERIAYQTATAGRARRLFWRPASSVPS